MEFSDSLLPSVPIIQANLLICILYLQRADISKSLLINQHWHIHVQESIKSYFWVHPCFSSSALHVLFILLEWFVRWEAGSCTITVLWGIAYRFFSRRYTAFLGNSHLAFFQCVSLVSIWCIHTVVWTQP